MICFMVICFNCQEFPGSNSEDNIILKSSHSSSYPVGPHNWNIVE